MKKSKKGKLWTAPECLTCLTTVAYEILQRATDDPGIQLEGMKRTFEILVDFTLESPPTDIANKMYQMIIELTGNPDPFSQVKLDRADIGGASNAYDRFRRAIAASITGNLIDFGTAGHSVEMNSKYLESIYFEIVEKGFAVDDSKRLFDSLETAKELLYIADNAGEVYFDTPLLNQIQRRGVSVTFVVKGGPISNDATLDDLDDPVFKNVTSKIITTGSDALGVSVTQSSQEFRQYLQKVDLIIAKGQSNFETLYYHHYELTDKPVFFILRTKCSCIAQFIGQTVGKNVVLLKQ
jgi:uncharacterized protein with ATP-grasp and redox domains